MAKVIILSIIFLLAFIIRVYNFTEIPAPHVDEISFGYSTYSLLKTGADEFGVSFPLILRSLGDNKLALYSYVTIPAVLLFGLNEFSMRLPSTLLGLASIPLLYYFTFLYTKDKRVAVVSALLLALLPWHIIFSRTANEVVLQLFLLLVTFAAWRVYLDSGSTKSLIVTSVTAVLALISYYSSFIFLPATAVVFIFLYRKSIRKKAVIPLFFIFTVCAFVVVTQPLDRVNQTSVFKHGEVEALLQEALQEQGNGGNTLISRALYNKVTVASSIIMRNVSNQLTLDYLFLKGDPSYSRYSLPGQGPIYIGLLLFILAGIYFSIDKYLREKNINLLFILAWAMLGLLPTAFSFENTIQRSTILLPPLMIFGAIGIIKFVDFAKATGSKQILLYGAGTLLAAYSLLFFINAYFVRMARHEPWHRNGYMKETYESLQYFQSIYPRIIVTHSAPAEFLFYDKTDPRLAQKMLRQNSFTNEGGFITLSQLKSISFMPTDCPTEGKLSIVYVCKGAYVPFNSEILKVIRYPNDFPARIFLKFTETHIGNDQIGNRIHVMENTKKNPQIIPEDSGRDW
ncbi:MAG: glycosyltransferase family 39 protein [bacterium]|nr:glycosyltransferase family 39 protein [bacterium]